MASALFKRQDHADLYSKFRPSPPEQFVQHMIKYLGSKIQGPFKQAVDIGCGTGQSTVILASHFEKVTGVDVSEAQIESARRDRTLPNVDYKVADGNVSLPFDDASVHLVASCEAIHWFDLDPFYTEVRRILVPDGAIAAYGYWIPMPQGENEEKTQKMKKIIDHDFSETHIAKHWGHVNNKRLIAKNLYVDLPFPFKDVQRFDMVQKTESLLSDYIRYLSTFSGYQKLYEEDSIKAEEILKDVEKQLLAVLDLNKSPEEIVLTLHSDFFLLMGRC